MCVLILAPHQDDEILGSYYYMRNCMHRGDHVFVAFATNGDRWGREVAAVRYEESVEALKGIGVDENHIFCMGYGDTGMKPERSFLYKLYHGKIDTIIPSSVSQETYHPTGRQTVHRMCTGHEATYSRRHFLEDLSHLLILCKANVIIFPSILDAHGDHQACYLFLRELQHGRSRLPSMFTYLIHTQDDLAWPNRYGETFRKPYVVNQSLWNSRLTIHATEEWRLDKLACIRSFHSQQPDALQGFLCTFAKLEEIFLPAPPS